MLASNWPSASDPPLSTFQELKLQQCAVMCGSWGGKNPTQDFENDRQTLYQLSHSLNPNFPFLQTVCGLRLGGIHGLETDFFSSMGFMVISIKCHPWSRAFEYLVPCGRCCLGRLEGVALLKEVCLQRWFRRWTLRFQKLPIIPSSLTLFCACSSRYINCSPARMASHPSGPLSQINPPSLSCLGHHAL